MLHFKVQVGAAGTARQAFTLAGSGLSAHTFMLLGPRTDFELQGQGAEQVVAVLSTTYPASLPGVSHAQLSAARAALRSGNGTAVVFRAGEFWHVLATAPTPHQRGEQ